MQKKTIIIVSVSILILIAIAAVVAANVKLTTYTIQLDVEGVNSYPPRMTQLFLRDVKTSNLLSILPSLNIQKLSVVSAATEMNGRINMICGAGYEEVKTWSFSANTYGIEMVDKITFEGVPAGTTCIAEAITMDCSTTIEDGKCEKLRKTLTIKTPGASN